MQRKETEMSKCLLCDNNESDMEFNTPTSQGMLTASICLECWGSFNGNNDVAFQIMLKRQKLAIPLFNLPPDIAKHWSDVPQELRNEISAFLLQGPTVKG